MEGKGVRFKVNFSEDGASKLSHRLTLSLKDYMGDFVDDTLVKYVIVLLGNGRSKEEVKEDLDVFLGDNSDAFVTWLWDHLASDLDQYVEHLGSSVNDAAKPKSDVVEHNGEIDSQQYLPDSEKGELKSPRSRHNRDWKGLMSDESHPPLRSAVSTDTQNEEKAHRKVVRTRRPASPIHPVNRKRSRVDERPKREVSQTFTAAPRRLLQFAVRDAVATTRPSISVSEPAQKRLRSVVSTPTGISSEEALPQMIHPVARVSNPAITAIRAVAEAAEDVRRVKHGNVFDRLSRGVDDSSEPVSAFTEPAAQGMKYEDYDDIRETRARKKDYRGTYKVKTSLVASNTGPATDSASDNNGYGNILGKRVVDISETGTSRGNKADESSMVQYGVAHNAGEMSLHSRKKGQEPLISAGNTKHKIVNISVNVNTWKPPHQLGHGLVEAGSHKIPAENDTRPANSIAGLMKDYKNPVSLIENGKSAAVSQKELQKTASGPGSNLTAHPLEDADSRTIFVNNVHFAATKDTLSRHFNKFGDVLNVMILTDAATANPKGSAYVEFMGKEAAENALTMDGTSFMSRIIKVVKKSSAQPEASPSMPWPRNNRASSFTVTRFAHPPFPRIFPGVYRGWSAAAMKPSVRNMQWKRDTQQKQNSTLAVSGNITNTNTPSASRSLTYVRALSNTAGDTAGP